MLNLLVFLFGLQVPMTMPGHIVSLFSHKDKLFLVAETSSGRRLVTVDVRKRTMVSSPVGPHAQLAGVREDKPYLMEGPTTTFGNGESFRMVYPLGPVFFWNEYSPALLIAQELVWLAGGFETAHLQVAKEDGFVFGPKENLFVLRKAEGETRLETYATGHRSLTKSATIMWNLGGKFFTAYRFVSMALKGEKKLLAFAEPSSSGIPPSLPRIIHRQPVGGDGLGLDQELYLCEIDVPSAKAIPLVRIVVKLPGNTMQGLPARQQLAWIAETNEVALALDSDLYIVPLTTSPG